MKLLKWLVALVLFGMVLKFFGIGQQDVTTTDAAVKALRGVTFEWKDDTGLKMNIPTAQFRITFNDDATKCSVKSKSITEDTWSADEQGQVTLEVRKYIDTGGPYVSIDCSATGFGMTMDKSDSIFVGNTFIAKPI